MAMKAGIWIDHKRAIVVLITDAGRDLKTIDLESGQPIGRTGRTRATNKYTPNDFVAEDKLGRKVENARKNDYDKVMATFRGADSLLILGPGEAKEEFSRHLKAKKLRGVVVALETADKLTERQLAAKVQACFTPSSATKSVAPKSKAKPAPKRSAPILARKKSKAARRRST